MAGERTRAPGELEAAIMDALWAADTPLTSPELQDRVAGKRPAQTTLLTALDRLGRKGMVRRVGESVRRVRFEPALTEAEYASQAMLEALPEAGNRGAALLKFAGNLAAEDLAILQSAIAERSRKRP